MTGVQTCALPIFAPAEVSALFALDLEPSLDAQPKASASDLEPLEFSQDQPELAQLSLTPAGSDPAMAGLSPLPAPETRRQNVVLRSSTDAVSFEGTLAHPSLAVAIPEGGIRTQATGLQRIEARDRMQFRPAT